MHQIRCLVCSYYETTRLFESMYVVGLDMPFLILKSAVKGGQCTQMTIIACQVLAFRSEGENVG